MALTSHAEQSIDDDPGQHSHESISCIGQGLVSCFQVVELQTLAATLRSVCLHGNNISRVEGLQQLTALQELNLSSNAIARIEGLQGLTSLTSLNLASNRLSSVQGLDGLPSLTHLNVSYNSITSLAGLSALQGPACKLRILNVKHNALAHLQGFAVLVGFAGLRDLSVAGNPLCNLPNYRQALLSVLPQITQLDNLSSTDAMAQPYDMQAAQKIAAMRLHAFEAPHPYSAHPGAAPPAGPSSSQAHLSAANQLAMQQRQATYDAQQYQILEAQQQSQRRTTPQIDAVLSGFHKRQTSVQAVGSASSPSQIHEQTSQPPSRPPANWQTAGRGRNAQANQQSSKDADDAAWAAAAGKVGRGQAHAGSGESSAPQKIYLVDAAAQTVDSTDRVVKALQAEAEHLKQQLIALTDELERRNMVEEEGRQQMAAAMQELQEDAHRRIEEGYREASQAVSKALQEVELARKQAQENQERCTLHMRLEEEAKLKVAMLEKDVTRLQEEMRRAVDAAHADARKSSQSAEDERRRALETEKALQAQLQALSTEASVAKAAAATAEQRVSSLESALQQSSSVTVSMTSKIAQTMADANAQVDTLRGKLAAAEAASAEAQRRESELRAEVSVLSTTLATAQQQHAKEVAGLKQKAEEEVRVLLERERSAAEERGRAVALMAAQQDKSALQEQLTFLKMQLQYALKESEKEVAAAQAQVASARSEVTELQGALQAAALKHREHEQLVADFTQVVQQQKAHIQALQKEKDSLSGQVRSLGGAAAQHEALLGDLMSLRKAAAEAGFMKEQAEHHRKQWQEAERRLSEAQVAAVRAADEAAARHASLEAALAAAKEEARQAQARADAAQKQLSSADDALKVKRAMLDSANDTIAQLKAELADVTAEYEDARRAADDAEAAASKQADVDAVEKANLRSELEAGESALESMSNQLGEAQAKAAAAEEKAKQLQMEVEQKLGMLAQVQTVVDSVQGTFETFKQKEAVLVRERDEAVQQAKAAKAEAEAESCQLRERLEEMAQDLQRRADAAAAERQAARAANERLHEAQAECEHLKGRVAEAEQELQTLLVAYERLKMSTDAKLHKLATFLTSGNV